MREQNPSQHWSVYRLYDSNDVLLYVGMSGSVGKRLGSHETQKCWWSTVANVVIERFATREEARKRERHYITWLWPLYNRQYNWRRHLEPSIAPVSRRGAANV